MVKVTHEAIQEIDETKREAGNYTASASIEGKKNERMKEMKEMRYIRYWSQKSSKSLNDSHNKWSQANRTKRSGHGPFYCPKVQVIKEQWKRIYPKVGLSGIWGVPFKKYQVDTIPLTVTWTTFLMTWNNQFSFIKLLQTFRNPIKGENKENKHSNGYIGLHGTGLVRSERPEGSPSNL